jgi:hypothetical protein
LLIRRLLAKAQVLGAVGGVTGGIFSALFGAAFTLASWLTRNQARGNGSRPSGLCSSF